MKPPGQCLQEALLCAQSETRLTAGVYESAKHMTEDPDSVSFCVLAMDEEFECDIALQIHFTLIQSFCFDNDISIVRVSDMQRLAEIVGNKADQLEDAHCVLITVRRCQMSSIEVIPADDATLLKCSAQLTSPLSFCLNRVQPRAPGRTRLWRSCICSARRAAV
uniref:Growth arrest and DNA damage inducible gamma n=1 Tax=Takifugu rubripes TaxID=31033 RepID=A0A674P1B0_TAKRU